MKQLLLYLINPCLPLAIYIIGCNTGEKNLSQAIPEKTANSTPTKNTGTVPLTYAALKSGIAKDRETLVNQYRKMDVQDYQIAANKFMELFENRLIPSWMGTTWDFNGTTKTPKKGAIACGYFVTTTLFDMGIAINVAKYAQCGSDVMVKHLIDKKNYSLLSALPFDQFISTLKKRKPFLAIIGLDFHTGYILNNGKELYFIHSSYINRRGVIKQIAAESPELKGSQWKSLGFITEDEKFMKNWLRS